MKSKLLTLWLPAILLITVSACGNKGSEQDSAAVAEDQNEEKLEDTDLEKDGEFAVKAADGGMLEVQLGALAQKNASSEHIKKFAQHMIDEHSKANDELKQIALQKNISLPANISEEHQKRYDELAKKTGAEFDKEYIEFMVKDHEDDIDLFEKEAENGKDTIIRSWAAGKISTLHEHHRMARATEDVIEDNKK